MNMFIGVTYSVKFIITSSFGPFVFSSQIVLGQNETSQHHQRIVSAQTDLRADGFHEPGLADRIREIPAFADKV